MVRLVLMGHRLSCVPVVSMNFRISGRSRQVRQAQSNDRHGRQSYARELPDTRERARAVSPRVHVLTLDCVLE
eukprot:558750-Prymnesium_polylepis.1